MMACLIIRLVQEFIESELGVSLKVCYNCSTCATVCPVALETGGKFNPRTIVQLANCGYEDRLIFDLTPNVWDCTMCEICQEECPQKVNLHEIFIKVKNAAAENKHIPDSYLNESQQVWQCGKAVPIQPAIAKRREQMGLPVSSEDDVAEIQFLLNLTPLPHILHTRSPIKPEEEKK